MKEKIKVLMVCHGSNARFQKNPVNTRVTEYFIKTAKFLIISRIAGIIRTYG